jgi:hypothetical protein
MSKEKMRTVTKVVVQPSLADEERSVDAFFAAGEGTWLIIGMKCLRQELVVEVRYAMNPLRAEAQKLGGAS